jgi:hypothetical protein
MTTKRYTVTLFGLGGALATVDSEHPWHPTSWSTKRGDLVQVYDRLENDFFPDYYIQKDGE